MKTGKEIKISSFKNYNVILGSVNNKQPKTNYISISAWADPKEIVNVNYNRVISDLNKKIKQLLFNELNLNEDYIFTKDKIIVDLDIRESGIKFGKRSFINCEVTLFLDSIVFNNEEINDQLGLLTKLLIDNIFKENKYFKFYKRKV
jgi:hypothetical protein